ncbi:uncharacterized protein PHACADRAFT_52164, partial [Phanerochaete carnosa HHB-10118-sp]
EHHGNAVVSLSFSPNGPAIVLLGSYFDETSIVWDVQHGCVLRHLIGRHSRVLNSTYSPNGALIATADTAGSVKIWDTSTGACLYTPDLDEHVYQVTFSPDSSRLCLPARNSVTVWDAVTGQKLLTIDDERKPTSPVAFSPDGAEVLAVCQGDQMALAFDSRTGQPRHTFELSYVPHRVAYSPNGDYVVFADDRGSLEVYNAKS